MEKAREAVEHAESQLRHSVLVGSMASEHARLGSIPRPRYDKVQGKERHHLVQEEV